MDRQLQVELGSRSYPICIGRDLHVEIQSRISELRSRNRPVALITDTEVAQHQESFLNACFGDAPRWELPAGEVNKSLHPFIEALEFLAQQGFDRSTVLFAVGGGVVGDFAGFVAASYMRGIEFVQVPTTLLAMVDSSVGGKTGVNLKAGKNLVGAFHQPSAVYVDLCRLDTLPERQFNAGMAEIIKAGLLADREFFEQLESMGRLHASSPELVSVIARSCEIKAQVVASDERESASSGGRALLNLGHTFGHAIEQVTQYTRYLHGEAIAIGMRMACELSEQLQLISSVDTQRVIHLLQRYELPVCLEPSLSIDALMTAMGRDKKKREGSLKYVVLKQLGSAATQADVDATLIERALQEGGAI